MPSSSSHLTSAGIQPPPPPTPCPQPPGHQDLHPPARGTEGLAPVGVPVMGWGRRGALGLQVVSPRAEQGRLSETLMSGVPGSSHANTLVHSLIYSFFFFFFYVLIAMICSRHWGQQQ